MGLPPGWVTDLITVRDDRFRLIGNAVVPQQAALALQLLASQEVTTDVSIKTRR